MTKTYWFAVLTVAGLALALRLPRLHIRPMHGDEAIHAYKFGELLTEGKYLYDPEEYHGPTLNYATCVAAWLRGEDSYAELTDFTLRVVPVFFGMLVALLPLLLRRGMGRAAALIACAATAISPVFAFYSRYYIQEMLLVCFTSGAIVCGYRYARSGKPGWVVMTGICLGLMHATKETCVIAYAAMGVALVGVMMLGERRPTESTERSKHRASHIAAGLLVAVITSALFFSSFLRHPQGVVDSVSTYVTYLNRAGQNPWHIHPWYYYLKLLVWNVSPPGPPWTEMFVVTLAAVGLVMIILRKGLWAVDWGLLRFLALYTVVLTAFYSVIPYKTPWCVLSFYHGMILLAAVGAVGVVRLCRRPMARIVVLLFLLTVSLDMYLQAYLANYVHYADHVNPWVYAHPTEDVFAMARRIEDISQAHPEGRHMPIEIVCLNGDYWPLPWYLREFDNIGWRNDVEEMPRVAPVVVGSAELESELIGRLYCLAPQGQKHLYVPLFERRMEIRPTVELRGYVTKDLADAYQRFTGEQADVIKHMESTDASEEGMGSSMTESKEVDFIGGDINSIVNVRRFSHEAMATVFDVFAVHEDERYAEQAVWATFDEVDRLEQQLSRYIPNSDISRINALQAGGSVAVSECVFECLQVSAAVHRATGGAFDVTIGSLFDIWLDGSRDLLSPSAEAVERAMRMTGTDLLRLDREQLTVQVERAGVSVDLGAVGKGLAVDKMAELLREWDVEQALISSGHSTVLPLGAPSGRSGWPVTIRHPSDAGHVLARLNLRDVALSGSGMRKGQHIIDPRLGRPVEGKVATWASAKTAAEADALSTAFMVMSVEQVRDYCGKHSETAAMLIVEGEGADAGDVLRFGAWEELMGGEL